MLWLLSLLFSNIYHDTWPNRNKIVRQIHSIIVSFIHSFIHSFTPIFRFDLSLKCVFQIYLLRGYVLLLWHVCCFLLFCLFVRCLFVCLFVCFFKVWWWSLKSRVIADNGGHDPEHPVNEILAIRRYHVIYTIPDRYSVTRFIQV